MMSIELSLIGGIVEFALIIIVLAFYGILYITKRISKY